MKGLNSKMKHYEFIVFDHGFIFKKMKSIKSVLFDVPKPFKNDQKGRFWGFGRKCRFLGVKNTPFWGSQKDPKNSVFGISPKINLAVFQPDFRYLRVKHEKTRFLEIARNVPRIRHLLERPRRTFHPPEGHRIPVFTGTSHTESHKSHKTRFYSGFLQSKLTYCDVWSLMRS